MIEHGQPTSPFGGDDLVEVTIPTSCRMPDSIADMGRVRLGGLHKLLPWFLERILGGGA